MSLTNVNMFEFHDEDKANDWISWYKIARPLVLQSLTTDLPLQVQTKMFWQQLLFIHLFKKPY